MDKEEIEILKTMLLMKTNSEKKLVLTDEVSNYLYNAIVNYEEN